MKCKKITITQADLNLTNESLIDVSITDENGIVLHPNEVLFVNSTGINIGVIYLEDDAEKLVRLQNRSLYDFLPIPTGRTNGTLPSEITYIIASDLGLSATGDLDIYLLGFN